MPTSVALSAHFETFIKEQVASGRYNNASEVVRDGLRLLEDEMQNRELNLGRLRVEIQKGLDSGAPVPAAAAFARARQAISDVAKAKAAE